MGDHVPVHLVSRMEYGIIETSEAASVNINEVERDNRLIFGNYANLQRNCGDWNCFVKRIARSNSGLGTRNDIKLNNSQMLSSVDLTWDVFYLKRKVISWKEIKTLTS